MLSTGTLPRFVHARWRKDFRGGAFPGRASVVVVRTLGPRQGPGKSPSAKQPAGRPERPWRYSGSAAASKTRPAPFNYRLMAALGMGVVQGCAARQRRHPFGWPFRGAYPTIIPKARSVSRASCGLGQAIPLGARRGSSSRASSRMGVPPRNNRMRGSTHCGVALLI